MLEILISRYLMSVIYENTVLLYVPQNISKLTIFANTTAIKGGTSTESAFWDARDSIEEIYFENNCLIKEIPNYCFYSCNFLKTIDFSTCPYLSSIGDYSFYSCYSIENIILPYSLRKINHYTFFESIIKQLTIPKTITELGSYAFYSATIENFKFEPGIKLTTIPPDCFNDFETDTFIIPKTIKTIDSRAFYHSKIKTIQFASGSKIEFIGSNAFTNSTITEFHIPKSLKSLGTNPFLNCTNLSTITIDQANKNFSVIDNTVFSIDKKTLLIFLCNRTGNYYIPNHVKSINSYSFAYSQLSQLTFSSSIETIGDYAFWYSQISDFVFSSNNSVNIIPKYSFAYNDKLTKIELPEGVEVIENHAFRQCSSLTYFYIPTTLPAMNMLAPFLDCSTTLELYFHIDNDINKYYEIRSNIDNQNILYINNGTILVQLLKYYPQITNFSIPSSVEVISNYSFSLNSYMKSVLFENDSNIKIICDYSFNYCTQLDYFSIFNPSNKELLNIEYIGYNSFYYCTSFSNFDIKTKPNQILTINQSFSYCNCSKFLINQQENSTILIELEAFYNAEIILFSINQMKYSAILFSSKAFYDSKITNFSINQEKDSSILIGSRAFYNAEIPNYFINQQDNSSILIKLEGFYYSKVQNIHIKQTNNSLILINSNAFISCYLLQSINIEQCFNSNIDMKSSFPNFGLLKNFSVKQQDNSLFSLESKSFYQCSNLSYVNLGSFIQIIPDYCFYQCYSLTSLYIPSTVQIIGSYAFSDCKNITSVGNDSFSGCYKLYSCLNIENKNPSFLNSLKIISKLPAHCICFSKTQNFKIKRNTEHIKFGLENFI